MGADHRIDLFPKDAFEFLRLFDVKALEIPVACRGFKGRYCRRDLIDRFFRKPLRLGQIVEILALDAFIIRVVLSHGQGIPSQVIIQIGLAALPYGLRGLSDYEVQNRLHVWQASEGEALVHEPFAGAAQGFEMPGFGGRGPIIGHLASGSTPSLSGKLSRLPSERRTGGVHRYPRWLT
jgi:hypothetical protein